MSITRVGSPRRNIVAVMRSYIIAAVDVSETSIQRKGLSVTHFYIPFYPHGKHNKALKHDSRLTSHLPEPSLQTRCASRGSLVRYVCKSLNWSGGRQHAVSKTFYSYFDTEQVQASLFAKMPQWTAALQSAGFHISFSSSTAQPGSARVAILSIWERPRRTQAFDTTVVGQEKKLRPTDTVLSPSAEHSSWNSHLAKLDVQGMPSSD